MQLLVDIPNGLYANLGKIQNGSIAAKRILQCVRDGEKAESKTGHWKRISMDKYVQHAMAYYRCSECGNDIIGEHNYCPNCGAKMQEVEE